MRYLLDTHVFIWWQGESPLLAPEVSQVLATPGVHASVSAITLAEIAIKRSLRKLDVPDTYVADVAACGFEHLPFTFEHAAELETLPFHHRDPFDRMLIAQARAENMVFLTQDPRCRAYDVRLI